MNAHYGILSLSFRGPRGLPHVPAVRVLGGEHPILAGLRGPQEGAESRVDRGEGESAPIPSFAYVLPEAILSI